MYYQLSNCSKNVCSFSRKSEKPSKSLSFEEAVIGGNQFSKKIFLSQRSFIKSLFSITAKIIFLSFKNQEILQFKVTKRIFSNLTVSLWGPLGYSFYCFFEKNISRKKTSAIGNTKNLSHNHEFMTQGCRQLSGMSYLRPESLHNFQIQRVHVNRSFLKLWGKYKPL